MRSNVFVVGYSKVGKTPLARRIAERLNLTHVPGSEWIKARYAPSDAASKDTQTYIDEITALSLRCLAENPDACVNFIRAKYDVAEGGLVIEGLRNPRDFTMLYRPDVDVVIFLNHASVKSATLFEQGGVDAIMGNVAWMEVHGIARPKSTDEITIDTFKREPLAEPSRQFDLDDAMDQAVWFARRTMIERTSPRVVHAELPRTKAWVENRVLYNDDPEREGWTPCTVVGVSSYVGHTPTFSVLTDDGAMFSYIPIHRLRHTSPRKDIDERMALDDLVYHDSREGRIVATQYRSLVSPRVLVATFKRTGRRCDARYVASIDWYDGNDLLHFVALANGQFALLPSHKLQFGIGELPNYKKLRAEWRVGR